jgi:hypothetical protein
MIDKWMRIFLIFLPQNLRVFFITALAVMIAMIAFLLTILLIGRLSKLHWKDLTQTQLFYIQNQGNHPLNIRLQALALQPGVTLGVNMDGKALPTLTVPVLNTATIATESMPAPSTAANPQTPQPAKPATPNAKADITAMKDKATKAKAQADKGLAKVKGLGTLLGTLGGLLPGELGAMFKQQSTELQAQAQSAGVTMQIPEQKLKTMDNLKQQASQLAPKLAPAAPETVAAPALTQSSAPMEPASSTGKKRRNRKGSLPQASGPVDVYCLPPTIAAQDTLELVLSARPQRRYGKQDCECLVKILPVLEDSPAAEAKPRKTAIKTKFEFKGLPWAYLFLTIILGAGILAINFYWAYRVIDWLSQFLILA